MPNFFLNPASLAFPVKQTNAKYFLSMSAHNLWFAGSVRYYKQKAEKSSKLSASKSHKSQASKVQSHKSHKSKAFQNQSLEALNSEHMDSKEGISGLVEATRPVSD